jgi:hypothetical protein
VRRPGAAHQLRPSGSTIWASILNEPTHRPRRPRDPGCTSTANRFHVHFSKPRRHAFPRPRPHPRRSRSPLPPTASSPTPIAIAPSPDRVLTHADHHHAHLAPRPRLPPWPPHLPRITSTSPPLASPTFRRPRSRPSRQPRTSPTPVALVPPRCRHVFPRPRPHPGHSPLRLARWASSSNPVAITSSRDRAPVPTLARSRRPSPRPRLHDHHDQRRSGTSQRSAMA